MVEHSPQVLASEQKETTLLILSLIILLVVILLLFRLKLAWRWRDVTRNSGHCSQHVLLLTDLSRHRSVKWHADSWRSHCAVTVAEE